MPTAAMLKVSAMPKNNRMLINPREGMLISGHKGMRMEHARKIARSTSVATTMEEH